MNGTDVGPDGQPGAAAGAVGHLDHGPMNPGIVVRVSERLGVGVRGHRDGEAQDRGGGRRGRAAQDVCDGTSDSFVFQPRRRY